MSLLIFRTMRGGNPVASSVVAPTLSSPTMGETTASVTFSGGSGYTTLIPQYSLNGTDWTSISNDTSSPFSFTGLTADTLYYFRALPDNNVSYASNTVSGTTDEASAAIFSDDFSSNDLTHTENGFSWGATAGSVSASTGALVMDWPDGVAMAEQRFSPGSTEYDEVWLKYDLTVAADYTHVSGNNKGPFMMWSNSHGYSVGSGDGYSEADELLISLEMNPNTDGGSALALRVFGMGYDYNASNTTYWPNFIVNADKGNTVEIVIRVKPSTTFAGNYLFATASDGICQVWKDGVKIMDKTDCNMYGGSSWPGPLRGYMFGERNGHSGHARLTIDNFAFHNSNIFGVS